MALLGSTVDLVHLRYAVAAEDYGSFRQAAEAFLLRQSTLSRSVRQMEERLGITVFERFSGGVRATPAGRDFLRSARSILEQIDALVTGARRAGRGEVGRLAIGFYTSLSAGNLRATLLEYAHRFPQMEINLMESSRARLAAALRRRELDIAIVTGGKPLLESQAISLWSERILIALPEGHRLASCDSILWTDLSGETLLVSRHDPGPEIQNLLLTKLASPADWPRAVRHDANRENIKSLVGAGLGVSLVAESDIGAGVSGLIYRDLRDGTGPARVDYSAHWRAENDNPALAGFLRLLRERYPSPFAPLAE